MKVFLDNCIMSASDTMQGAKKQSPLNWGGSVEWVDVIGYMRKPLPSVNHQWKRDQIECLPTIGKIAKEGLISLYTYFELQAEGWKRAGSFPVNGIGQIFSGVTINHVEAAVERSSFCQIELGRHVETQRVIDYCKWLISPGIEQFADQLTKKWHGSARALHNLKKVQRFRELCRGLAEKQYPDAFHLWSAELSGADIFLTIDGKFIRAMTESKNIRLPCRPVSPSRLLEILQVEEREPFEFREGIFYNIAGKPI